MQKQKNYNIAGDITYRLAELQKRRKITRIRLCDDCRRYFRLADLFGDGFTARGCTEFRCLPCAQKKWRDYLAQQKGGQ